MEPVMDGVIIATVAIILGFVAVGAGMAFLKWWKNFREELEDIRYEISISKGREREWWIRRRRRLWLSILPFVKYLRIEK